LVVEPLHRLKDIDPCGKACSTAVVLFVEFFEAYDARQSEAEVIVMPSKALAIPGEDSTSTSGSKKSI
jgi:hypothetical protein